LSDELNIDEASVAILVNNVVVDLLTVGEKAPDPVKVGVSVVVVA
jgi:hypothetical protein